MTLTFIQAHTPPNLAHTLTLSLSQPLGPATPQENQKLTLRRISECESGVFVVFTDEGTLSYFDDQNELESMGFSFTPIHFTLRRISVSHSSRFTLHPI